MRARVRAEANARAHAHAHAHTLTQEDTNLQDLWPANDWFESRCARRTHSRSAETAISLQMINDAGTATTGPIAPASVVSATQTRSLSATGSKKAPKALCALSFLARYPSAKSVSERAAKIDAGPYVLEVEEDSERCLMLLRALEEGPQYTAGYLELAGSLRFRRISHMPGWRSHSIALWPSVSKSASGLAAAGRKDAREPAGQPLPCAKDRAGQASLRARPVVALRGAVVRTCGRRRGRRRPYRL
eukprot:1164515-Pleurochrysis_carterae.AAC.2